MNVSRRWLEEFLRRPLEANDLARRLTMLGAAVDAIEPLHPGLEQVVIGLVETVRQHPNADRLSLCVVNAGSGQTHNVVCGAPNVTAGKKYPFARVGTTLPGGLKLEKRKIRGETSEGMLCSARELGLGADHEGILELDTDAAPGTPLLEAIPLADDRWCSTSRPTGLISWDTRASRENSPTASQFRSGSPPFRARRPIRSVLHGVRLASGPRWMGSRPEPRIPQAVPGFWVRCCEG
jgi:EMAP domain